jgi:hypothetical protein
MDRYLRVMIVAARKKNLIHALSLDAPLAGLADYHRLRSAAFRPRMFRALWAASPPPIRNRPS